MLALEAILLRCRISDEYGRCLRIIDHWHQTHGVDAAAHFVDGLANDEPQAVEVDACRSLTKNHWRQTIFALEQLQPHEVAAMTRLGWMRSLQASHRRFCKAVQPLDIFSGCDAAEMWVYDYRFPLR